MASSEGKEPSSQSPELLSEKQAKSQTPESSKSDEQMKRKLAILPSSTSPDKTPQPKIRDEDLTHHAQKSESIDDIDGKQIHFI